MKRNFTCLCTILILTVSARTFAQVTVTSSDSLSCTDTCTTLTAHLIGDTPTDAGVTEDDIYSVLHAIGFTFNFYGLPYTQCCLGANGTLDFNAADATAYDPWPITAPLLGNPSKYNNICGPWCDIDIFFDTPPIGTETYSTDGVAPFRKFVVTWCGCSMYDCPTQHTTTQIIIYETTNIIEVHLAHKDICLDWNPDTPPDSGGKAIIGVQNATGTLATVAPGRDWDPAWTASDEAWRFTPVDTGTGVFYTVTSIPYAPVPYASSTIYWYNATTGAFIDTGLSITVCPHTTTTYKAGALGCADTSFGYYTVTPNPIFTITTTFSNPTVCPLCNGSITVGGLTPGDIDTINYEFGGVPQPQVTATVSGGGTIVLTGLCAGTYSNIIARQSTCISLPAGPVVLTNPLIPITTSSSNPTVCGLCDGIITIFGLTAGDIDVINYDLGGIPQTPVTATVSGGGSVQLTGLCPGTYSNIIVTQGVCTSTTGGPIVLSYPPVVITTSSSNPTLCGLNNGSISVNGLTPGDIDTINYDLGGVPQPTVIASVSTGGSILLTGLCAGTYSNIIATQSVCSSAPAGPIVLTSPGISISGVTSTNPSACGVCDGTITLSGLYPGHSFTVTYNMNGVAQSPVITTSSATGTITLTGLCGGAPPYPATVYDNIVASFTTCESCTTAPAGPATLAAPPPPPASIVSSSNATQCGVCDGIIIIKDLPPYSIDSAFYSFNGVAQPTVTTLAHTDSSVYLEGLCSGLYTTFTVSTGQCVYSVTGSATITQPGLLDSFTQVPHYGCNGDTVFFQNYSSTPGPLYYIWNFGDGSTDTATNPEHIFAQGIYTVTLVATNHHCAGSFQMEDSLIHPLKAVFTDSPSIICQGSQITFTNSTDSLSTPPLSYIWYFGDGATDNSGNPVHIFTNSGVYNVQLVATNFVPCHDTASSIVYIDSTGPITIGVTDSVLCRSSSVTFTGRYTSIGNTGVTWNFGDGDTIVNINPVTHSYDRFGSDTVIITAYFRACKDTSTSRVINLFEAPSVYLGSDTTICPGSEPLILTDNINVNTRGATWKWNTGQTTPSITVTTPGYYYVTVGVNGCYASDSILVQNDCYLEIPNVFTPNGDGLNDYFFPRLQLTKGLATFKMDIYNRWGQLIFETTSLDGIGWDGKLNGVPQPEGVYVYIIDATFIDREKEHHQGNVTLMR